MAWIDDIDLLNNAATQGNWTASGFDTPTLNDSASTTPIYLEGSACMWWPLKKGTTNGTVYTNTITGTPTLTNRVCVGFINYPFADISNIPISSIFMRLSSSTTFTTNYVQWDASAQLLAPENIPISGHTPVIGYEDDGTETGTFSGNCESVGWVATTGNDNDGKQGGFDWFFVIGWIGAHSATYSGTYFSGLASEYYDNEGSGLPGQTNRPIAVFSKSGDFYQTNVRLQFGDGASDTANIVVTETAKTVFFNNLHVNHELGYVFVDPASTHEIHFTLSGCVHFWNDQASANNVFTDASNTSIFRVNGCSFSRGGSVSLRAWISDVNTYFTNNTVTSCYQIDPNTILFSGNTISDSSETANTSGAVLLDASGTTRWSNLVFSRGSSSHAIEITATGTYTFTGFSYTDYGANGTDTAVIRNNSGGAVTIDVVGGDTPTYQNGAGSSTTVNNSVTLTITVRDRVTKAAIQNAQTSIRLADSPFTELMNEDTNVSGIATESYNYPGTPQNIVYRVRKSETTDDPRYISQSDTGQITSNGFILDVNLEENTFI